MVLEHFINLDRNLFAAEYNILTWRFMSSSSSKYWFMRIPKYLTLSENLILVPERKIKPSLIFWDTVISQKYEH